jgi:hypothetical protein
LLSSTQDKLKNDTSSIMARYGALMAAGGGFGTQTGK